jgi:Flp pilus assembly protein TadB
MSPLILVVTLILFVAIARHRHEIHRSAIDVFYDLSDRGEKGESDEKETRKTTSDFPYSGVPILFASLGGVGAGLLLFGVDSFSILFSFALVGFGLGVFGQRLSTKNRVLQEKEKIEFFLPIVMERVSMAVGSGLDVIPALEVVHRMELEECAGNAEKLDPVTRLLAEAGKLAEAGRTLDEALKEVASRSSSTPLRHAFIHLALAHREGGELGTPLQELADATQLYYQETVEEIIAKMPVKATAPLLCTFSGLIICFLTSPILQILKITTKSAIQ